MANKQTGQRLDRVVPDTADIFRDKLRAATVDLGFLSFDVSYELQAAGRVVAKFNVPGDPPGFLNFALVVFGQWRVAFSIELV